MEFKGLRVLESWNHTRKLWLLKIAVLFTKPCVSDLNSTLLSEIPAISSRHIWKISWTYLNSAVSLHPSKNAAPAPLNFQRNSHGLLCVCVCVCWKGTGCLTGLKLQVRAVNFYGISEFFLVGGGNREAGWGEKGGRLRKGGEELYEGWVFERGSADGWVQVLCYKTTLYSK